MIGNWSPHEIFTQACTIAVGKRSNESISVQIGGAFDGREIHLTRSEAIRLARRILQAVEEA